MCYPDRVAMDFPRARKYSEEWLLASISGAANPLWMAEWLTSALELKPGMRVLDLGCGRAVSSIFLRREFGVQVWAVDLWFNPTENRQRLDDAGVGDGVFPLRCDARSLPFAHDFFDAIVSCDSFYYYGTDDCFLPNIAHFLKPGGQIGIAGTGLVREFGATVPPALHKWWEPSMACIHSADWWRAHWERSLTVDVELADTMPDGWKLWLEWHRKIAPGNAVEIDAIEADAGAHIGYVRAVARRRPDVVLEEPVANIPTQYERKIMLASG